MSRFKKNSVEAELIQTAAVAVCWLEARGITQFDVLDEITMERDAQDAKWGPQCHLPSGAWLAILAEEFGEVGTALLDANELGGGNGHVPLVD